MKVSTRSRYGLRLMLELGIQSGRGPTLLKEISRSQEISEKYLSQIILPLKAAGLVKSFRGAKGGYVLAREPAAICVREIVEVLEGSLTPVECVDQPAGCRRSSTCVTLGVWRTVGKAIQDSLDALTLADLVAEHRARVDRGLAWTI